ncbi:TetR/AcrR family transcriptional regulator [Pseudomonas silvicola]|nr:TetR/AcrR family transcriptional regulator [Pseudomonas silvicola]
MDDIARLSGISRATLYRRFANREAVFEATLQHYSRPFEEQATRIVTGPESFILRMENLISWAVTHSPTNPILMHFFNQASPTTETLFSNVFRERISKILLPAIESCKAQGMLSAQLDPQELLDWLISQLVWLISKGPWEPADLKARLNLFVLPVLAYQDRPQVSTTEPRSLEERLATLEGRLLEVQQMLGGLCANS